MKISKYNIIKDFNDNILIYNTFSKASLILEKDSLLKKDIFNMTEQGMKKIAIITRDVEQAKELYLQFEDTNLNIQLIACSDSKIVDSNIIIPSYLSKGLEFDGVIIYNNPDKPYIEDESNLYYVVCTRAQHKLNIYNEPKYLTLKNNNKL